jgi:hypothetical protein
MVLRDFLNPDCSGPMKFLLSTYQLRRFVRTRSNSLPRHEVRLMGRKEAALSASFPGFRRGITIAFFQSSGTKSLV